MKEIIIDKNEQEQRLDRFLKKYLKNAPLSTIYKFIRKDVKVNGKKVKANFVLQLGDRLTLYLSTDKINEFTKSDRILELQGDSFDLRKLDVAYEDDNILVANKPSGLLTHGDATEKKHHLTNYVVDYLISNGSYVPRVEKTFTPSPVNRLDRNTTGLVLFAKNNDTLREINECMRNREAVKKFYLTIVKGTLEAPLDLCNAAIKDLERNKVKIVDYTRDMDCQGAKNMETKVWPIASNSGYSLVKVQIITGRTHQIRVHLSNEGYPIIGDIKYGNRRINDLMRRKFNLKGQLLHAYRLEFYKLTGFLSYLNDMAVEVPMPDKMLSINNHLLGEMQWKKN